VIWVIKKRLDLDLSEEVYERLLALSRKSGRSIQEIVEQILCASVADLAAEEDP
jgi:predicted DNA-binding protein